MNQGYVIKFGKSYLRSADLKTANIVKEFGDCHIFTKKKSAVEVANRFGGKVMEVNLTNVEG